MPHVLIIEDDPESQRALAGLFAREGWKVLQATDGDVGIELALRNRPELILCDLLMPKSNGFQVCRTIREQLQPTKIIVVSGRDYGVDKISALQAGADEYCLSRSRGNCSQGQLTGCSRRFRVSPSQHRQPRMTRNLHE